MYKVGHKNENKMVLYTALDWTFGKESVESTASFKMFQGPQNVLLWTKHLTVYQWSSHLKVNL